MVFIHNYQRYYVRIHCCALVDPTRQEMIFHLSVNEHIVTELTEVWLLEYKKERWNDRYHVESLEQRA
jgi:hypothetical protein